MKTNDRILAVPNEIIKQGYYQPEAPHVALCSRLLKSRCLKGWEHLFVSTLIKSSCPGRKQIQKLEAIASRLGYSVVDEGSEA